jgi:hypothetical protein
MPEDKAAAPDSSADANKVVTAKTAARTPVADKPTKIRKSRLARHKVTMPEAEYDQLTVLKKRIASLGGNVTRSELMRGGLALLAALGDTELAFVMAPYGRLKTRRRLKKA